MVIAGRYSFNNGEEAIQSRYLHLLAEIEKTIAGIDATRHKTKSSKERTKAGQILYSPIELNRQFKTQLEPLGWKGRKIPCEYPTQYYTPDYKPKPLNKGAFRAIDFVKEKLGVEVQFGKYAFMGYDVCAKMPIFRNFKLIDTGIEIVPIKQFAVYMSSGVSFFEQFIWDLQARGVSDLDIPVLILGIDTES